jgi:hypothetical protein
MPEEPHEVGAAAANEHVPESLEEPLVAPPEKLRKIFTRPRMLLGFALSVMVTVLITRLFSLHLRHNFGVVRSQAHEPEFLAYAVLCVLVYLVADMATLVLLTRVLKSTVRLKPLVLLSLRANFVGGTTSFGGVEIPYQAFSLRRQGLTLPEATSAGSTRSRSGSASSRCACCAAAASPRRGTCGAPSTASRAPGARTAARSPGPRRRSSR